MIQSFMIMIVWYTNHHSDIVDRIWVNYVGPIIMATMGKLHVDHIFLISIDSWCDAGRALMTRSLSMIGVAAAGSDRRGMCTKADFCLKR